MGQVRLRLGRKADHAPARPHIERQNFAVPWLLAALHPELDPTAKGNGEFIRETTIPSQLHRKVFPSITCGVASGIPVPVDGCQGFSIEERRVVLDHLALELLHVRGRPLPQAFV